MRSYVKSSTIFKKRRYNIMKLLIASDLHGGADACALLCEKFDQSGADALVLLGDVLYHGPRNDLPAGYAPKKVISMLNPLCDKIICVRGNCDAEVDQMVLQFPIRADSMLLPLEGDRCAFVTHGHLFNTECPPPHKKGDVLIHGHTHVHGVWQQEDYTYINPGSAALPKEGQPKSYMVYEDGVFTIKQLENGEVLMSWKAE